MWKLLGILALMVSASGCASNQMNRVSLGMTKPEVIRQLGSPNSTSAQGSTEYLNYSFYERAFGPYEPYFVKVVDGKVESYGRLGDFDSTKTPTTRVEVDATVKQTQTAP